MAFAIPSRIKILNVLETLAIGTAGGALFLLLNLPGGLISGATIAVGIAAIAGRPLTMPPILTQTVLVLLGIFPGLTGVAAAPAAHGCLSADHRTAGAGDVLLHLRQQHLSAARPRLGPDLGVSGGKPRRAVADHHARDRERRRRAGNRRGADHAGDHSHRGTAAAAGADRDSLAVVTGGRCGHRLAARTG